jgi:ubiquinone/menaquinone biosynthesis C-methylase UbiE
MNEWLANKEAIEINHWRDSVVENPNADSIDVIITRFTDAKVLLMKVRHFMEVFNSAETILELGAGQGWGACLVKYVVPGARVMASDISEYAIASAPKWERLLQVSLERTFACRSYDIPLEDSSVDLIFCFHAAHHFVAHRRTLAEVHRVLRRGGRCLYLNEPSCRRYIHRLAHRRVNKRRPTVPEDVLVYPEIVRLAREAGLEPELRFDPNYANRRPLEAMYYMSLSRMPFLQHVLPCAIDYVFEKP